MPYEKESTYTFNYPLETVFESALTCVPHMGGKVLKQDQGKGVLHAQMDKKLFGDYLGDRSKLEMRYSAGDGEKTDVYIFAYPLNAVGQKLMFGARQGVVEKILAAFCEEMEKNLNK